tara:strand:+ start:442 stop:1098 length:657 start_codon:yes stop_codon:yes gene_type:complete
MIKFSPDSLPNEIPLFPLSGVLLLPKAKLPLNIFEPKYLAMLDDVLKTQERLIGMIQPSNGFMENDQETKFHSIGCAGRVVSFNETKDGRYLITLEGISRYKLERTMDGFFPYLKGSVIWKTFPDDLKKSKTDRSFDRNKFLTLLAKYFDAAKLSSDWSSLKEAEEELLINSLSMLCPFEPEEKQALLEASDLQQRRETLMTLMEFSLKGGTHEGTLQ